MWNAIQSMDKAHTLMCARIESTAQKIFDARNLYPDSSFTDLYDEVSMPVKLGKAHRENDKAVCKSYGWPEDISKEEIVGYLFKLYSDKIINDLVFVYDGGILDEECNY